MLGRKRYIVIGIASFGLSLYIASPYARAIQSTNFRIDESTVGTSGVLDSKSANYGTLETTGDIGAGNSLSSNFQINAGSNTTADPRLSFSVDTSSANFGTLSATSPSTATTTFTVLNYTTYGYVVQIFGSPPNNGAEQITPMTIAGPSQVGTKQFGINLVANTSPSSFGANPDNGQYGYGSVMPNYSTSNIYKYTDGDTIVRAVKDSGLTHYTISYLVNVAGLTKGGQYAGNQTLVVMGTY